MAKFRIDGRDFFGKNITITHRKVIIDGVIVEDSKSGVVEVRILEGVVENLHSEMAVTAGEVTGNVRAGMEVRCGNVGGNVDAGMNVDCGTVGGNVDAGMSVKMRK